jgi:hypothetical protein
MKRRSERPEADKPSLERVAQIVTALAAIVPGICKIIEAIQHLKR